MHDRTCLPDLELVLSKAEQPANSGSVAGYYSDHSIVNSPDVAYTMVSDGYILERRVAECPPAVKKECLSNLSAAGTGHGMAGLGSGAVFWRT